MYPLLAKGNGHCKAKYKRDGQADEKYIRIRRRDMTPILSIMRPSSLKIASLMGLT